MYDIMKCVRALYESIAHKIQQCHIIRDKNVFNNPARTYEIIGYGSYGPYSRIRSGNRGVQVRTKVIRLRELHVAELHPSAL